MKFSGTTLYAWGYSTVNSSSKQGLITINTTTAAVTAVGTPSDATSGDAGLAINSAGTAFVAANAAAANILLGDSGALDQLNMTSGAPTSVATLDWPVPAPIHAMAYVNMPAATSTFANPVTTPTLIAVVDDGAYGQSLGGLISGGGYYGEELVVIDTTKNPMVSPLFAAPAEVAAQSHISAIAVAPTTLTINRSLPQAGWAQLGVASLPTAN
jgi:hypothetical protein